MIVDARLRAWLGLHSTAGVGTRTLHTLLQTFGSAQEIIRAPVGLLAKHVPYDVAQTIAAGPNAAYLERTERWLAEEQGNRILTWDDAEYPQQLLAITDPPPLLYVKGNIDLLRRPALAIVGSRNATPQGIETAQAFAHSLSEAGVAIVSGLALGIDAAAHRGALHGCGGTMAVVGTGLDRIYPARNRDIAHAIAQEGALVSEFVLGTPPLAGNFPRRNRIISGLARGCLIVEATVNSGSLITARLAGEQGREVFAIPGSIHSPFSKGCHKLIRDGAKLVETAQDILEELRVETTCMRDDDHAATPGNAATGEAKQVLAALGFDSADIDTLCLRAGISADRVQRHLLELELAGSVAALPGGRYQRLK